jgi:hypothetical protein
MTRFRIGLLAATALVALAAPAMAQLALSGTDNKAVLDNGVVRVVANPAPRAAFAPALGRPPRAEPARDQRPLIRS